MRWKAGPPTTIAGLSGGQGQVRFIPTATTLTHETPAFRCMARRGLQNGRWGGHSFRVSQ